MIRETGVKAARLIRNFIFERFNFGSHNLLDQNFLSIIGEAQNFYDEFLTASSALAVQGFTLMMMTQTFRS